MLQHADMTKFKSAINQKFSNKIFFFWFPKKQALKVIWLYESLFPRHWTAEQSERQRKYCLELLTTQ